jgi:CobQ-like glutamine amidotransferase family enzyme
MSGRASTIAVALLFPDLLGTYGDSGNAAILAERLRWRGFDAEVLTVRSGDPVPAGCQVYVVGGGEDLPQALAARQLGPRVSGALARAVDHGAGVLAVCAGLQILGVSFVGPDGVESEGLGLIDCVTRRGPGRRAVGEIVVEPEPGLDLPVLSGYENHAGVTSVGPGAAAAGRVLRGIGNGDGSGTDGVWAGRVIGTYLHGPVLARNPELADRILSWAVGDLAPLDDGDQLALRAERLAATAGGRRDGRRRLGGRSWALAHGYWRRLGPPGRGTGDGAA